MNSSTTSRHQRRQRSRKREWTNVHQFSRSRRRMRWPRMETVILHFLKGLSTWWTTSKYFTLPIDEFSTSEANAVYRSLYTQDYWIFGTRSLWFLLVPWDWKVTKEAWSGGIRLRHDDFLSFFAHFTRSARLRYTAEVTDWVTHMVREKQHKFSWVSSQGFLSESCTIMPS